MSIAAVFLAVTFAGFSKGGFAGVGMIATPIMALVMPPVQAASIMLPILLIQDAYSVASYRKTIDWRNIRFLYPGAVAGIAAGYLLAAYFPVGAVALMIGVISIVFALRNLTGKSVRNKPAADAHFAAASCWGMLSGFTSMIAHAGSPPFQIYIMPQKLTRDLFVGTSVVFFAMVNWTKVLPYLLLGQLTRENLVTSLTMAPLALAATWVGIRLVRRIDTERFYIVIYVLLGLVGAKLSWDGITGLF